MIMMTKLQLIAAIADETGSSKVEASAFLAALTNTITGELKAGNEVTLPGIGKIAPVERDERTGRSPATGEQITIPGYKTAKLKVGKELKDALN